MKIKINDAQMHAMFAKTKESVAINKNQLDDVAKENIELIFYGIDLAETVLIAYQTEKEFLANGNKNGKVQGTKKSNKRRKS